MSGRAPNMQLPSSNEAPRIASMNGGAARSLPALAPNEQPGVLPSVSSEANELAVRNIARRRSRRDTTEEIDELRGEFEELQYSAEQHTRLVEHQAREYAQHERTEAHAALTRMQNEANSSVAYVHSVAAGYEQEAQRSVLVEQASVSRLHELESSARSYFESQQVMMSEMNAERERQFAAQHASLTQELTAMSRERDRQQADAHRAQQETVELQAQIRSNSEQS